jgi:translation elongation factor EF-Ts
VTGKTTGEGLVGVAVNDTTGVCVEISCETDFVARGASMSSLLEQCATAALGIATETIGGDSKMSSQLSDEQVSR